MYEGKLIYSGHKEAEVEVRDRESMEAFKEGIPEVVVPVRLGMGMSYWEDGTLGVYVEVSCKGVLTRKKLEERYSAAETPGRIATIVETVAEKACPKEFSPKGAGEFRNKLKNALNDGIKELRDSLLEELSVGNNMTPRRVRELEDYVSRVMLVGV